MLLNELLSLKRENVNLDDKFIVSKNIKSSKEDSIPLNVVVIKHIKQLGKISEYVIYQGNCQRYKDVLMAWHRVINKAGLFRYTPHVLAQMIMQ